MRVIFLSLKSLTYEIDCEGVNLSAPADGGFAAGAGAVFVDMDNFFGENGDKTGES